MKKVYIYTMIENNDEKLKNSFEGEASSNIIKYRDNETFTSIKFFEKNVILTRKNKEYSIKLIFKEKEETIGIYDLKEINKKIKLKIYTKKLNIEKACIYVEYDLYDKKIKIGEYKYILNIREDI